MNSFDLDVDINLKCMFDINKMQSNMDSLGKKQILLIDDEIFNLQALEIMLCSTAKSLGHPQKFMENKI